MNVFVPSRDPSTGLLSRAMVSAAIRVWRGFHI